MNVLQSDGAKLAALFESSMKGNKAGGKFNIVDGMMFDGFDYDDDNSSDDEDDEDFDADNSNYQNYYPSPPEFDNSLKAEEGLAGLCFCM